MQQQEHAQEGAKENIRNIVDPFRVSNNWM